MAAEREETGAITPALDDLVYVVDTRKPSEQDLQHYMTVKSPQELEDDEDEKFLQHIDLLQTNLNGSFTKNEDLRDDITPVSQVSKNSSKSGRSGITGHNS